MNDNQVAETMTVDAHWGERQHRGIVPQRGYHGGMPIYSLRLIRCEVDDPQRFGFWRGSWWRIAGDDSAPDLIPGGQRWW